MGSWFSNVSFRKNGSFTKQNIIDYILKLMFDDGYELAESEKSAHCCFAVAKSEESEWITLYSDFFSLDDPQSVKDFALPVSELFDTSVLAVNCFDSDYLFLNLINAKSEIDAWASVGSSAGLGIGRKSKISDWKKLVKNFELFKESFSQKYVCAEDVLKKVESCLGLPSAQSATGYDYLKDSSELCGVDYLFFKLPENDGRWEPPKFQSYMTSLSACRLNSPSIVSCVNAGGRSKGLTVYFTGKYVEHEDLTFTTQLVYKKDGYRYTEDFELEKVQLDDGQWVYWKSFPDLPIPGKVDERLPGAKRDKMLYGDSITVRFYPHGNPRKLLDVTVYLIPEGYPEGQMTWCVWHMFGSREEYAAWRNENAEEFYKYIEETCGVVDGGALLLYQEKLIDLNDYDID